MGDDVIRHDDESGKMTWVRLMSWAERSAVPEGLGFVSRLTQDSAWRLRPGLD
jgi:hypothetical protein